MKPGRWRYGLAALGLACAAGAFGCSIDNRRVRLRDAGARPGGLVIATFERGTGQPDDARFEPFQFYAFSESPDSALNSPIVSPGHTSNFALGLNWRVIDAPDGVRNFPGVGVRTLANGGIDLSSYARIVFAERYDPTPVAIPPRQAGACQAATGLTVSIGCNEHNTSFEMSAPMTADWTTTTLAFADFREPSYRLATGTTMAECLKVADAIMFQSNTSLLDGECAAGSLLLDDISVRPPEADADADGPTSTGIAVVPDAQGLFDGNNPAGLAGGWWSAGDYFGFGGTAGGGTCPGAGFPMSACSVITTPSPDVPFKPDANGRMCAAGIAARVLPGSDGMPAWGAMWGNLVGFDFARTAPVAGSTGVLPYDAIAHGITGFAFDIDAVPAGGQLRVEFPTTATRNSPGYWMGGFANLSPITAPGRYEMRWADVGGPFYLGASAPRFEPTQLESIQLHVVPNEAYSVSYSFCLSNVTLLTN